MTKKSIVKLLGVLSIGLLIQGCSTKNVTSPGDVPHKSKEQQKIVTKNANVQRGYIPEIRMENSNVKPIVDMGLVAEVRVAPYRSRDNLYIAEHSTFIWLEEPSFKGDNSETVKNNTLFEYESKEKTHKETSNKEGNFVIDNKKPSSLDPEIIEFVEKNRVKRKK